MVRHEREVQLGVPACGQVAQGREVAGVVGWAFVLAVLGVALPLFAGGTGGRFRLLASAAGGALPVVGTVIALIAAVNGFGVREQPTIEVQPVEVDRKAQLVTLRVSAQGLSLACDEHMLLRVAAFGTDTTLEDALRSCASTGSADIDEPESAEVLFWGENGPGATGTTSSTVTVKIATSRFRYGCAHAVLTDRERGQNGDDRMTTTVVTLPASGLSDRVDAARIRTLILAPSTTTDQPM